MIDEVAMDLLDHENVTGLSADFKIKAGKVVRPLRYALRVSVAVKRHKNDDAIKNQLIPKKSRAWKQMSWQYVTNTVPMALRRVRSFEKILRVVVPLREKTTNFIGELWESWLISRG